jgi:hypothetical protein
MNKNIQWQHENTGYNDLLKKIQVEGQKFIV